MINLGAFKPHPKPEPKEKKKPKPLKQNTPIPKKTKKQQNADARYNKKSKSWIEGRSCPCCGGPAEQVHHKKGRKGYADKWAYDRGIPLLLDERYWLATCFTLHDKIERNPEWAKSMGYTLTRTDIIVK